MDLGSIGKLLSTISVHYPAFKKHILDNDGNISKHVADEWHRLLGFLDYEEALKRLDAYLRSEKSKYPPGVMDFLQYRAQKTEYFHSKIKHKYHVDSKGRLLDEYDREYADPRFPEEKYYYDSMGRICQRGRVIS